MTALPNLSEWHRVPVGATIPKNTPYAYTYEGGITVDLRGYPGDATVVPDNSPHFTERPIARPPDKCPACRDYRRPCECGLL